MSDGATRHDPGPQAARSLLAALERAAALALALAALSGGAARANPLPDPMRPPLLAHARAAAPEPLPVLSGIVTVDGRRSAIVDGRLVHAGSPVGGCTVEAVLIDGVRLRTPHGPRELHLPTPTTLVKKPAAEHPRGESP